MKLMAKFTKRIFWSFVEYGLPWEAFYD